MKKERKTTKVCAFAVYGKEKKETKKVTPVPVVPPYSVLRTPCRPLLPGDHGVLLQQLHHCRTGSRLT